MAKVRFNPCHRRTPLRVALLALAVLGALTMRNASAQPAGSHVQAQPAQPAPVVVPLSEFANRDAGLLVGVNVKLTYLSEQTKPIPTVVFGSFSVLPSLAPFKPFEKRGHDYGNDALSRVEHFSVGLAELKAMLQKANTIPAVQRGSQSGTVLSFGVVDSAPGSTKGLQVILDRADAQALVAALQGAALPGNAAAKQTLSDLLTRLGG